MQISTTRFGVVDVLTEDILLFPFGLIGFEEGRHWVLLGDAQSLSLGWLQSIGHPDTALAVVSPRRFLTDYQIRIAKRQIRCLELAALDQAYVLAVVGKNSGHFTLNLKAPIVINLDRKLGRQVVVNDEYPVQWEIAPSAAPLRKTA